MAYRVIIPTKVSHELSKIEKRHRDKILVALKGLEKSPLLGKKLWGQYAGFRSFRSGEYRIIYQVKATELIVLVVKIGNRQGIY